MSKTKMEWAGNKMKSILFSTHDVRATLDGRKTQIRMVIKPQPPTKRMVLTYLDYDDGKIKIVCPEITEISEWAKCPYRLDQILWVKEAWGTYTKDWKDSDRFLYRADYPDGTKGYWHEPEQINWCDLPRWQSPFFMPKEAARLFLLVKSVSVEQLQDVNHDDALAEGIDIDEVYADYECGFPTAVMVFASLWDSLNAKRGYPWENNPWVWVYEFMRTEARP